MGLGEARHAGLGEASLAGLGVALAWVTRRLEWRVISWVGYACSDDSPAWAGSACLGGMRLLRWCMGLDEARLFGLIG